MQLALGAIYSYGIIKPAVIAVYGAVDTIALMPFAFGLLSFAIVMVFAGRWQDRAGPKIVALVGGVVLTAGYVISGLIAPVTNTWGLVVTYGVIGGAGIGFGYVCPIACASKWFPDMKGLINGLAVAGFGAGAFIFNYIFKAFIGTVATKQSLAMNFIVSGLIMGGMVIAGALILRNPPEGYKPEGWEPPATAGSKVLDEDDTLHGADWEPIDMIKTPSYWLLWGMFVCSAMCGLMVIGNYKSYGLSISPVEAGAWSATVGGIAALFNGLGRIFWGKMSDILGRSNTMKLMFAIQGGTMLTFALVPNIIVWVLLVQVLYFCFGGNFSLFPSATGDYFGSKNLGFNYGLVFTAYGIAGIVGAVAATPMLTLVGSYLGYFLLFGILSFAALAMAFLVQPPKR